MSGHLAYHRENAALLGAVGRPRANAAARRNAGEQRRNFAKENPPFSAAWFMVFWQAFVHEIHDMKQLHQNDLAHGARVGERVERFVDEIQLDMRGNEPIDR